MEGAVLAIDYGRRRIGMAVSDPLGIIAQGMPTLEVREPGEAVGAIRKAATDRGAVVLVVGLPLQMDGQEGPAAREARSFGERLRQELRLPVEYIDERLTSAQAENILKETGTRAARRAPHRDRIAAQIILEGYLARRGARGVADDAHDP